MNSDEALNQLRTKLSGAPPKPDQTAHLVFISPDKAETELREHNNMNRDINMTDVDTLVRIIDEGKWQANGATVTYDIYDEIVDGQHRYAAIGKSGKGQWLWVIRGLLPNTRPTVDDHRRRTFRDDLSMNDITGGTNIENVTRKVLQWQEYGGLSRSKGAKRGRVMRVQLAEVYRKNADSINAALQLSREFPRIPQSYGSRAFLCWLFSQYAPEATVRRFLSVLSIGSLEKEDNVIVKLRDKYYRDRAPSSTSANTGKVLTAEHVYFAIRAWNAWVTKEDLRSFSIPPGGLHNPFPQPIRVEE